MGLGDKTEMVDKARVDAIDARITDGKVYVKDAQGTPHYWRLTIVAGVLVPVDAGTTAPTDGVIGVT